MIRIPDNFSRYKAEFRAEENQNTRIVTCYLRFEWGNKMEFFSKEYGYYDAHTMWEFFDLAWDYILGFTGQRKPVQLEFDFTKG